MQGGFRRRRGCYDQVTILHELLLTNSKAVLIFFDMKAAYDTVPRDLLWSFFPNKWGNISLVRRLRALFDFNAARLMVSGHRSKEIRLRRGLLQGSSLSPILFNLFIDTLLKRLEAHGGGCMIGGRRINHLFFADDAVVVARNWQEARELVAICERWAIEFGMMFAPTKCAIVTGRNHKEPLYLHGEPLPVQENYTYLGMVMDHNGVDWKASYDPRIRTAANLICFLRKKGMNWSGWRPISSVTAYKTFIRPTLEYGMALGPVPKGILSRLQVIQNTALRSIASVQRSSSVRALHRLYRVEPIAHRQQELHARYHGRLHNATHRAPIVDIYRKLAKRERQPSKSLLNKQDNAVWPHIPLPNLDAGEETTPLGALLPLDKRTELRQQAIMGITGTAGGVGSTMSVLTTATHHLRPDILLRHSTQLSRKQVQEITNWRLGMVARHQSCAQCGEPLSRRHALECARILPRISSLRYWAGRVPSFSMGIAPFSHEVNALDDLLGQLQLHKSFDVGLWTELADIIRTVMVTTAGWDPG